MIQKVKINSIFENLTNPRTINKAKFKKLVKSVKEFPEMLKLRPIVVNAEMGILGGNMRYKACQELKLKEVYIIQAKDLTESQIEQFIIKDNVGYGDWEWDILANSWDIDKLEEWGVNVPTIKNTELLSGLDYKPMYYEPKEEPNINLEDCLDLTKYNEKIKALDEYNLTKEQKKILKMFAYRFIKIDFESVANYHSFNANEDEQKAIERLRLVLTDDGSNGFIEDDLLRLLGFTDKDFF
jgi:hypothetical protein